ncbi:hypothetical protein [Pseudonocardia sp. N23]|uniref:hypothetical protein n=1 Tax=Pseudonocardia sp. N23 TaxID=1987376 RepID=UPI000BFD98FD|nr:hypothetical protein [Pseudonocardia sp. N23]GAY12732.1 hypothetical protein TOK_1282 [Pseudonocardia sp. N23]
MSAQRLDRRSDGSWVQGPGDLRRLAERVPTTGETEQSFGAFCVLSTVLLADAGIGVRNLAGGVKAWAGSGRTVARDGGTPGAVP